MKAIFSKMASNGITVEVLAKIEAGYVTTGYALDGTFQGKASLQKLNQPKGYTTHYMRCCDAPAAGFTAEEASQIEDAIETLKQSSPEYQIRMLREQREDLVRSINAYRSGAQDRRNTEMERRDGTGQWVNAGDADDAIADNLANDLMAFDGAHPDVIAQITIDKDESIRRHMWD